MVNYKTAKGTEINVYIETEASNIADHNHTTPCYNFVVEVAGLGRLAGVELVNGLFTESCTRKVNGKAVRVSVPANDEAAALYKEYVAEVNRRSAASLKADAEYREHRAKVEMAMAE